MEINRGKDRLVAWDYPNAKRQVFNYTDTLRLYEPAFTTKQTSLMLNRSRVTIETAIKDGMIERPQFTYAIGGGEKEVVRYMWREKDILDLLDYLASLHRGRPRKDGGITPAADLPTPREVRAMVRHNGETLGTMEGGTFVPSWRAKER